MQKKIIALYVGWFISTSFLVGVANEKESTRVKEEIQFTKKDYIKTGAALGGTLFFMSAALRTSFLMQAYVKKEDGGLCDYPSGLMALPVVLATQLFLTLTQPAKKAENYASTIFGISGTFSGILTGLLGNYVYNKVGQFKRARALDKKLNV